MIKKNQASLNEKGFLMIIAIFLIVIIAFFGLIVVSLVGTEGFNAVSQVFSTQAFYLAEGGGENGAYQFRTGTGCAALGGTSNLGAGTFTLVGTQFNPNPLTTLTVALPNSTATTSIQVVSNALYAPHGRVQIDSELIRYAGVSGTNLLTGAQRGINGTTVTAHAIGASVLQGECLIRSTGTIASAVGSAQRVVEIGAGVSSSQGSFTKSTAGAPAIQSINTVPFQPKAVIFFWTRQTAANAAPLAGFNQGINAGIGFAAGAANESVSVTALDQRLFCCFFGGVGSADGRIRSQAYSIVFMNGGAVGAAPTAIANGQITSFNPDGFTINWTVNDGNAYIINYIALGGDITSAFAGAFSLTNGAGNQSLTGVGFQPDFAMFLWSHSEGAGIGAINSEIGLGLAKSATSRGALVYAAKDGSASNTGRQWQQRTDSAILLLDPTVDPPIQDAIADLVSMDADGFTLNKSNAPAVNTPILFLALKGGRHQVGSFNQATATGNQATTGVGFRPEQLMLASFNLAAQNGVVGGGGVSYGAANYRNVRGSVWFQNRSDFLYYSDANMYTSSPTANVMTMAYGTDSNLGSFPFFTEGNPTIVAQADLVSFGPDGFTLNWTTANAPARQILYWAIGPYTDGRIDWQEIYR